MDGVAFTGTVFCAGDNVTFICDIQSFTHQWDGPEIDKALVTTTKPLSVGPDNRFTSAVVNFSASGLITSLSGTVYSGFNGTMITCSDGNPLRTNIQTATTTVLGKI